ncbi:glycosyltransferase family 2 protein [Thermostaphylospora chromogena]|uniref:Glycosyltransferase like family 2 n=1 Tax=Thermostaphylospora chromogena TaxID=35622 RepID=A0A1H1EYL4_9ACTN|nr:glycosyltransferase [Thermostaphylospora chromogena]SDQ93837.1 Glycosyltransferase like family 2 [Thermostaphylospora chromogena]
MTRDAAPPERATPRGFRRTPERGVEELRWAGEGWTAAGEPLSEPVTAEAVARLRPLAGLRVEWPGSAPCSLDAVLDLAAAGVPLFARRIPDWVRRADPGLAELLSAWDGDAWSQAEGGGYRSVRDLRREEHSVRLRRHAHRTRRAGSVQARKDADAALVSVVMASMRPHLLGSALRQIARQRHVRVEALVGLHGVAASAEPVRRAVAECPVPVKVVEAPRKTPFGEVLNRAAAMASGDVLAKWDDDDWYGPEHLSDLLMAREYSGADVVGTAAEFFYLEPLRATIRRTDYSSEVWSDHVAGGTILLSTALFRKTGGFAALERGVDADLLKRIHAAGGRIYRTHGLGYVLRRSFSEDHTWRLPLAHFLRVATNQWRGLRPSLILEHDGTQPDPAPRARTGRAAGAGGGGATKPAAPAEPAAGAPPSAGSVPAGEGRRP